MRAVPRGSVGARGRGPAPSSAFRMPRPRSPSTGTTTIRAGLGPPGPARTGPFRSPAAPRRARTRTHGCSGATAICTSCSTRPMRTSKPSRTHSACASRAAESSTPSRSRPAESCRRRGAGRSRRDRLRGEAAPTCRARFDGTPDEAGDVDEEWSVEMAVPLASVGMRGQAGESAGFAIERCDAPPGGARVLRWLGRGRGLREPGRLVIE